MLHFTRNYKNLSFVITLTTVSLAGIAGCNSSTVESNSANAMIASSATQPEPHAEDGETNKQETEAATPPTDTPPPEDERGKGLYDELEEPNQSSLPPEAEVVLADIMEKIFVKLKSGDMLTRLDALAAYSIEGTSDHLRGDDAIVSSSSQGFLFHKLTYRTLRRRIGIAEQHDNIVECYDVIFTSPCVTEVSNLSSEGSERDTTEEEVRRGLSRNVKNPDKVFPVLSLIRFEGSGDWFGYRGDALAWFTSDIHSNDINELNSSALTLSPSRIMNK